VDRYINVLYQIVSAGQKTNSYKFALWRALAKLAPATNETKAIISKHNLSPVFLEYYWPLEVKYHIRQGIDPKKDPIVMVQIRELMKAGTIKHGESLKDFQKRMPTEYQTLVTTIAKECFNDVIPRFHNVHGAAIAPEIFRYTGTVGRVGDNIQLTDASRRFLLVYKKLIDYIAVSGWVRFTEQFTAAPKLHDKIDGSSMRRGAVSVWREPLIAIQQGKCFYDQGHDMSEPEVDHVLPWSFVLEDRTWNLVLACRDCNNQKRDRLTDTASLKRLCDRNDQIRSGKLCVDAAFGRHFEEWQTRNLSSYVKALYDQAVADGFPGWK
jgi:HNH endonuclease